MDEAEGDETKQNETKRNENTNTYVNNPQAET